MRARLFHLAILVCAGVALNAARTSTPVSCDQFLLPPRDVKGVKVGPQSCLMRQSQVELDGRAYRRLDLGLDGTVEGFMTKGGEYSPYVINTSDLVYPQSGDPGPTFSAIATYERDKGAAMTIVLPRDPTAWNGKIWVTAHGGGPSFVGGSLRAWDRTADGDPQRAFTRYEQLMLRQGFALVKTRRTATQAKTGLKGDIRAVLEDGTVVEEASFNETPQYVVDFAVVARRVLSDEMKRPPTRTYFYGHSSGARMGRALNYTPGFNRDARGQPIFDGFLVDDSGAGAWLPIVVKGGSDVLLQSAADKAAMVPQLEIAHQMYNNIWLPDVKKPEWATSSYLENKRRNAAILREKGLWSKFRLYEVRHISHSGTGGGLDLAFFMDRFVTMLDAWVDKGVAPPPTRSDVPDLGDADRDGRNEHPAIDFPEAACPLGVYYPPTMVATGINFAAFSGNGLEPLDRSRAFVDMNRNGVWDRRETPTQAWRRLGLLRDSEELTRDKYMACLTAAVSSLEADGFISPDAAAATLERGWKAALHPKDDR